MDKFTDRGISASSTKNDINTHPVKAWTAVVRLSVIWRSDLSDKIKRNFFQASVVPTLIYGYITWTLTKRIEKKLNGNCTRMLPVEMNKSRKQYLTKQQLYGHLPLISKNIQAQQTRHAGHCWGSKNELISKVLLWTLSPRRASLGDLLELIYSNSVRTQDVA